MTRDGFSLLAMGWTGAKALAFKVTYIDRFNAMEAALKAPAQPALPDFSNPALAARACPIRPDTRRQEAAFGIGHSAFISRDGTGIDPAIHEQLEHRLGEIPHALP